MSKIGRVIYSSCDKVSELIEKQSVVSLTPGQRLQLTIHLKICDACRNYQKQSALLDTFLKSNTLIDQDGASKAPHKDLKEKIKINLKDKASEK
ncbi:MAG: hypothetical protein ACKVOK_05815 [Flavobacteriales bacterium]